ncbi:MAG: ATP-binding protein [Nanobdellota archaeon]
MVVKGQIIRGNIGELLLRKKHSETVELGELLVVEQDDTRILCTVTDLSYSSQVSNQNIEFVSGIHLEESFDTSFIDEEVRHYVLCHLKPILVIYPDGTTRGPCLIPPLFSPAREVHQKDFTFLTRQGISFGLLRSGKNHLPIPIYLDAKAVTSHHILITGTTGKGKSVLMKNLLCEITAQQHVSSLIFDPHDEYYGDGGSKKGLRDTDYAQNISYYTTSKPPVGAHSLKINIEQLRPEHFSLIDFSSPQQQALESYYKKFKSSWIKALLEEQAVDDHYHEATLQVVKRRISNLLDLTLSNGIILENGIFSLQAGNSTIRDILSQLESQQSVIIDTSSFSGTVELLLANLITSHVFSRYRHHKLKGETGHPVISVVLEEAPRVLGKDVLENGSNVFASIAREGRKFGVGLVAITQLPSLIPKELLANMNTKIILGTEMSQERSAIIDSASHDLSKDHRTIAGLSKGEALLSSNFAPLAIPLHIPFFDDIVCKQQTNQQPPRQPSKKFSGVSLH